MKPGDGEKSKAAFASLTDELSEAPKAAVATSKWTRVVRHGMLAALGIVPLALAVKAFRTAGLELTVLLAPFSVLALIVGMALSYWYHRDAQRSRDALDAEHARRAVLLRHIAHLEALVDACRDVGAAGPGRALFASLAHQSRRLGEGDGAAVLVGTRESMRVVASEGAAAGAAAELLSALAERPFAADEPIRASSNVDVRRALGDATAERCGAPGSFVAVPMTVNGRRIGWIAVLRTRESTNVDDFATARSLSAIACIASSLLAATRANRKLKQSNARLKTSMSELARTQNSLVRGEKLRAVGELVSGVAHELTNPLAALSGYAQLLAMDPVVNDGPRRRWMEEIEREVQRATAVLRNLATFARRSSGPDRPAPISDTVAATLALKAYDTRKAGILVRNDVPDGLPMPVMGSQALSQVLLNLVNNAIAATEGRDQRELRIGARRDGNNIVLEIVDTGVGIAPERLPHIFEPFFTTRNRGDAIGLGLTTARQVMTDAGGAIDVASVPGRGTTFRVTVPVID